jgi:hypothetical protein
MLRVKATLLLAGVLAAMSQAPDNLNAQGKGGGKGHGGGNAQGQEKSKRPEKIRGNAQGKARGPAKAAVHETDKGPGKGVASNSAAQRGRSTNSSRGKFVRAVSFNSLPPRVRNFASSRHPRDMIVAAAVSHAFARGHGDDVRMEQVGDRLRLTNRNGDPLLVIDDRSAENLGRWRVGVLDDDVREGAPSFCRSGAGHPVWGREWCIDKGFGLGAYEDYRWGRTRDVGDIIYSRGTLGDRIMGGALENLLGTTAFNRLALHAVTLGLLDPLVGSFIGQPTGPQYLVVNSGTYPVAEFYDTNRDNRWDDLLIALRPW